MSKQSVLLLGATGETGGDILDGLIEDGAFDITCLIRPQTAEKPSAKKIQDRGIKTKIIDITASVDDIADKIKGFHTVISAIGPREHHQQIALVDAAAKAGTQRFVPCGFTTISPPNVGVMKIRDDKEKVHERIWYHHLPYTIIDVGFWHQLSFPSLPSGKLDDLVLMQKNKIFGDGNTKNLLTDKRDIGRFVARIIKDPRTLNKKVFTHSDALTQNEITSLLEKKSGEKLELEHVSNDEAVATMEAAKKAAAEDPRNFLKSAGVYSSQYDVSKYVRGDNSPEVARYLGYIDAQKLYPDFRPISFSHFLDEVLAGKGARPYQGKF